jgi:hypothetical protein
MPIIRTLSSEPRNLPGARPRGALHSVASPVAPRAARRAATPAAAPAVRLRGCPARLHDWALIEAASPAARRTRHSAPPQRAWPHQVADAHKRRAWC